MTLDPVAEEAAAAVGRELAHEAMFKFMLDLLRDTGSADLSTAAGSAAAPLRTGRMSPKALRAQLQTLRGENLSPSAAGLPVPPPVHAAIQAAKQAKLADLSARVIAAFDYRRV